MITGEIHDQGKVMIEGTVWTAHGGGVAVGETEDVAEMVKEALVSLTQDGEVEIEITVEAEVGRQARLKVDGGNDGLKVVILYLFYCSS